MVFAPLIVVRGSRPRERVAQRGYPFCPQSKGSTQLQQIATCQTWTQQIRSFGSCGFQILRFLFRNNTMPQTWSPDIFIHVICYTTNKGKVRKHGTTCLYVYEYTTYTQAHFKRSKSHARNHQLGDTVQYESLQIMCQRHETGSQ